jgi:small-conductance mechanosensitive channel
MSHGDRLSTSCCLPAGHNHWEQVRSDLAAAVYEAVYAAGMSFPFPQRARAAHAEAESTTAPVHAARRQGRTRERVDTARPR